MAEKISTGTGRGNAIGHVPGVARQVALGQPHLQPGVLGVGVRVAVRERLPRQPVLVVPGVCRGLAADGLRQQVAVGVVGLRCCGTRSDRAINRVENRSPYSLLSCRSGTMKHPAV